MLDKIENFMNEMRDVVESVVKHEDSIFIVMTTKEIADQDKLTDKELKAFEDNLNKTLNEFKICQCNVIVEIDDYVEEDKVCLRISIKKD